MSITEPTKFAATKQSGVVKHFIIELTDNITTWLIGNFEAEFTDGHVYALVSKYSIPSSADLWEKTYTRSAVNLNISNLPYKQSATGWLRLSDEIGNIVAKSAKIYLTGDPNTILLSDCLCVFNGITRSINGYDNTTIDIQLEDNGYPLDKVLLTKLVKEFK